MQDDKSCANCKWHEQDDRGGKWACVNPRSRRCTDYTDHNDCCSAWERRKRKEESR